MISSLAKLVVSGDERCRPSLNLIRILTFHTSQDYLNKAVDRNIDKILEIVNKLYIYEVLKKVIRSTCSWIKKHGYIGVGYTCIQVQE